MDVFICTTCGEEFKTREAALAHRRRTGHVLKIVVEGEEND